MQLKQSGAEAPWTDDPVFQDTYFCNVRREDDKVTVGIRNLWAKKDLPVHYAVSNMIMARMVNKVETLEKLGWPWIVFDRRTFTEVMSQPGSWGGAYIVSTNGRAMPKHEYIGELLRGFWIHFNSATLPNTLASTHKALVALQGLGSFMAAQVVADLKNTPHHPLADAEDWWTWSAYGPGSLRGLAWFLEVDKISPSKYNSAIAEARAYVDEHLPDDIPKFCNQDLQNCFCEFDKYMRVMNKTGRSKRKYNGRG